MWVSGGTGLPVPQEVGMALTEYGLFNDEGCLDAQMYSAEEAERRRQKYIDGGEHPDDVVVKEMCPDHEGEAKDDCEECFTELADDSEDEEE